MGGGGDRSSHRTRPGPLPHPRSCHLSLPLHCFPLRVPAMHLDSQDAGRDTIVLCLDHVYHHLLLNCLHGIGRRDHMVHPAVFHDHSLLHGYADANTCQEPASSESCSWLTLSLLACFPCALESCYEGGLGAGVQQNTNITMVQQVQQTQPPATQTPMEMQPMPACVQHAYGCKLVGFQKDFVWLCVYCIAEWASTRNLRSAKFQPHKP